MAIDVGQSAIADETRLLRHSSGVIRLQAETCRQPTDDTGQTTHNQQRMKPKVNPALSSILNDLRSHPKLIWVISILWLSLIAWIAFLWNLGSVGLVDETEPLFAEAARQMTVTGDWITPYFNETTRFDKPPLIYWLMAIAYKIVGVNEWGVRLPSALSAIALMVFLFFTLRYFSFPTSQNPHDNSAIPAASFISTGSQSSLKVWFCAGLGAAIAALNVQTIAWGRIGVSDMLLSACMGSALLAFFWGYAMAEVGSDRSPNSPHDLAAKTSNNSGFISNKKLSGLWLNSDFWYIAFYVLLALAVLTKGPVGLVLPGLIIGSFLVYLGKFWEVLREMRPLRGLAIFLAIAVPWYILVILANGESYIETFFGYHNFERFTRVVNRHGEPWYFYFLVILGGFAPWSLYLPVAIARLRFWQRDRWRDRSRVTHLSLFALCWFAGIFIFFTVAVTKLPSYVLPALPAAAILVAIFWSDETFKPEHRRKNKNGFRIFFQISLILNVLFWVAIAGVALYIPTLLEPDPAMPQFSEALQNSGLIERGALLLIATGIVGAILLLRRQWRLLIAVNLLGFMAFFIWALMPVYFLVDTERQLPVRQLAEIIAEVKQPGEEAVFIAFEKPSLVFYSHEPIAFFRRSMDAREYLEQMAMSAPNPPDVLILGYPNKIKGVGIEEPEDYLIAEAGNYRLVRVAKQFFESKEVRGKAGRMKDEG